MNLMKTKICRQIDLFPEFVKKCNVSRFLFYYNLFCYLLQFNICFVTNIRLNNITAASPPKFLSLPEIMVAAKKLEDIALVHEIAVNENFKLEPQIPPDNR